MDIVALKPHDLRQNLFHELWRIRRNGFRHIKRARGFRAELDLDHRVQSAVHCLHVHLYNLGTLVPVAAPDGIAYQFDRLILGQNTGNFEKGCLHDGVDSRAQSEIPRQLVRIDDVELRFFRSMSCS